MSGVGETGSVLAVPRPIPRPRELAMVCFTATSARLRFDARCRWPVEEVLVVSGRACRAIVYYRPDAHAREFACWIGAQVVPDAISRPPLPRPAEAGFRLGASRRSAARAPRSAQRDLITETPGTIRRARDEADQM
jgi:hypothetical protein